MEGTAASVVLVEEREDVRSEIAARLREAGFDVRPVAGAAAAAEVVTSTQPDVVVTDVWLAGMSGLQLCRVLRAERVTAHIPVLLVGAAKDRRGRFLAEHAGAAAFVVKERIDQLITALREITEGAAAVLPRTLRAPAVSRIEDRLAELLDDALSVSVVSSEVRSLANAGSFSGLFTGLALLLAQLSSYRWVALSDAWGRVGIHTHPNVRRTAETEARTALAQYAGNVFFVDESRESDEPSGDGGLLVETISFGGVRLGELAMATSTRSAADGTSEEERLFKRVVAELGGPMRMASLMEDAHRLAATDGLTGLLNRRAFSEALQREIASATRHRHALSLILFDVDHFKTINDSEGHAGGDAVLRALGRLLATDTRRSDLVGRWGGEEFVMALTHTDAVGARVVADRLCGRIGALVVGVGDKTVPITASLGVATLGSGETLDELTARADHAMYEAKAGGRNRVEAAA